VISSSLQVEKNVLIDFKSDAIIKLGIADIRGFDIDSRRNIFISVFRGENCVYKFDPKVSFLLAFARKGQGPGEMPIAKSLNVNEHDQILILDVAKQKLIFFNDRGELFKEMPLPPRIARLIPLKDGNYLVATIPPRERPSPFYHIACLSLYDSDLKEIKQLEQLKLPNGPGASYWMPWEDRIFVGSEERGYEIWVYDLQGNLIRKIKKEYKPVYMAEDVRLAWKSAYERLKQVTQTPEDFKVPEHWPPFDAFFIDEGGRLFVRTYEEGPIKGEYIHDIYGPDGIFIGRKSLDLSFDREYEYAKLKNGHIYGFSQRELGFEQFAVYRIRG
jgi:hypothetical protein